MPTPFLKKLSEDKGISMEKLEGWWDEAKSQASDRFNKPVSEFTDKQWAYVTGIVKRRAGDMSMNRLATGVIRNFSYTSPTNSLGSDIASQFSKGMINRHFLDLCQVNYKR